ncbi:MAG TPA: hypothetical protein VE263_01830 [Candidatus Angelobacter sp.]|nr:hypothetical protein [Candidatus Angelobacter sp.]
MKWKTLSNLLSVAVILGFAALLSAAALPAVKNMAVVVSASSKISDVTLPDLAKMCKGAQKAWPDGKAFTLVIRDPQAPEMRIADEKLFGVSPAETKAAIAKINEGRTTVKIVESDEELLRMVGSTPGAAGLLDVYSINSSVKVLRVDGKLPFDMGYALRGN